MKENMIKHFLKLNKNGASMLRKKLNENEIALCDGHFFFIQDISEMVLNKKLFKEIEKDFISKYIDGDDKKEYEEARVACYLPTYRKNNFRVLLKSENGLRVILDKGFLDLFDYEKLEVKGKDDLVKAYDSKGKLLGGILPMRCEDSMYEI